ncbi:MAG: DMT family transporter [Streptosporangiaceae bacterium]
MSERATPAGAKSSPAGLVADGLGTFAWSFTGVLVKLVAVSGLVLAFYRLWLGLLVAALAVLVTRTRLSWRTLRISAFGGLFFCADVALLFAALKRTSVADAMFIGSLQPVLVLLVANKWFGERLSPRQLALMALAITGVAGVVLGGKGGVHGGLAGDVLAVGSLLAWAAYWVVSKRVRADLGTLDYLTGFLFVASLLMTPIALAFGGAFAVPSAYDWLWLAILGLVPTTGHFLFNWAHRHVAVTISSLVQSAVPVVAAAAAYVILGEPLTGPQVAGGLIAVGAVSAICVTSARPTPAGSDEG